MAGEHATPKHFRAAPNPEICGRVRGNFSPVRPGFDFAFASVCSFTASWHPMTVSHQGVALQLIMDYQSFNSPSIEYCIAPLTALEFSRYVRSNRLIVIKSCALQSYFDKPDAIREWPALRKWKDLDYLKRVMGSHTVTVAETPNGYSLLK